MVVSVGFAAWENPPNRANKPMATAPPLLVGEDLLPAKELIGSNANTIKATAIKANFFMSDYLPLSKD